MKKRPKPRYAADGLSEGGIPVRVVTRSVEGAEVISDEISRGARVRNPLGDVVQALAPAAILTVGLGARSKPKATVVAGELPAYVVYSPGSGGRAREARTFAPEWGERARELENVGTIVADHELLEQAFGKPIAGEKIWDDGKTQVVWLIEFDHGEWATVFDYQSGLPPEHNDVWRVAGWDPKVLDSVQAAINAGVQGAAEVVPENTRIANAKRSKRRLLR